MHGCSGGMCHRMCQFVNRRVHEGLTFTAKSLYAKDKLSNETFTMTDRLSGSCVCSGSGIP